MEQELVEQVRQRMAQLGITQDALAKKAFGETASRQHIHPYLSGSRGLLTGNGLKVLHALGIERLKLEWKET